MFDLLIKNGTVIDGTGKPAFRADVGIKGDSIAEIGDLAESNGRVALDASGLTMSPGFIDMTNHSDVTASIFHFPTQENLVRQGITTILGGNCGSSLAPLADPDLVHGIRKWTKTASISVNWAGVGEFLDEIERRRLSVNFGTLVGHGTIRRGVTGEKVRPLSLEEIAGFKYVLKNALREGAFGLSSNLGSAHEFPATPEEMAEIGKTLAAEGGIYKAHLRDEGVNLISAVNEALRVGAEAGVPISISHLKAAGRRAWPLMKKAIRMVERDALSGHRAIFDVAPYMRTNSHLYMLLPYWVREGGFHAMLDRLANKTERAGAAESIRDLSFHYDKILIAEAGDGVSPGKTIAELAARSDRSPEEVMMDLLIANRGQVTIIGKTLHPQNVRLAVKSGLGVISTNGSGSRPGEEEAISHPRSYGAIPHFFHKYVREAKLLTWEEAIKKLTSIPAGFLGLEKRGKIVAGHIADLVIFNPATVRDRATYQNPAVFPEGIDHVAVSGELVLQQGQPTNARPGRVLRKR